MATKYFCDRCQKGFDVSVRICQIEVPRVDYDVKRTYDLCDSCLRDLHRFLEPLLEAVEKKQ